MIRHAVCVRRTNCLEQLSLEDGTTFDNQFLHDHCVVYRLPLYSTINYFVAVACIARISKNRFLFEDTTKTIALPGIDKNSIKDSLKWLFLRTWFLFLGRFWDGPVILKAVDDESLSQSLIDGDSHLSVTKCMTSPSSYITFWRRMRAIAPKFDGREELVWKCRINEATMMVVLIDGGRVAVTSNSRGFMSVALWVFCMVPSTWLRESGTGVSGYLRTSSVSMFCCNEWYRIHPNRSHTKQAATGHFTAPLYLFF